RGESDDRLASGRADRAAVEVRLGRDAPVEHAVAAVRTDLAGEVDGERLRDRYHAAVGGDDRRVADVLDREEGEARVAIDEVVEPAASHGHARHHLPGVQALARPGHHPALDEIDDRLGDDGGVDAQVAALPEEAQHLVRHAPETDLQRGAVLDDPGHVAGDALGYRAEWLAGGASYGGGES